jgi:16S rRNA (cytidine1402-2'-O)-methyltransferase
MNGKLYIISTPIGNLADISQRAVIILGNVDLILAEDTRITRKLLAKYKISCKLLSCHKFNEASRINTIIQQITQGSSVALVTTAGTPCISDPGSRLITACRKQAIGLTIIPGPSAVSSAVAASGFFASQYLFAGFLPYKSNKRIKELEKLRLCAYPVVLFESPYRILKLLDELSRIFSERELFIGREMTKIHEQFLWGTAREIKKQLISRFAPNTDGVRVNIKGEFTLVIAPAEKKEIKENS